MMKVLEDILIALTMIVWVPVVIIIVIALIIAVVVSESFNYLKGVKS